MKHLDPVLIRATDLPDSWFQLVFECLQRCQDYDIDSGSFEKQAKRLEFDFVIVHILYPHVLPMIPKIRPGLGFPDPVDDHYIDSYLPYLMEETIEPNEAYTYGNRIRSAKIQGRQLPKAELLIPEIRELFPTIIKPLSGRDLYPKFVDQMELMIWTYKNKGPRNNQMILQVGHGSDMILKDPPCLRHIDTRIQNGKLHFFPYFRSWDLWGGYPANLQAIELMKQYCSQQIGVENGEIIATSKGLHLYNYSWELAEAVRGKTIKEFREEMQFNIGDL